VNVIFEKIYIILISCRSNVLIFLAASLGTSSPRNSFDDDDVRSGSFEKHIKPDESISIKTLLKTW
jgi:hypothetical protein